ncbi:hypothetical protein PPROV_000247500 [Pycnococcus provasolii]|uniref:JmjC domain-containing protein n=1 Tax=Pycnococcus provasolii TaxID=41880 RepID=A0A830HCY3_9CHLO|nr:hypothetical protein PPROV_000247500 [Pycnococcus provasolii]
MSSSSRSRGYLALALALSVLLTCTTAAAAAAAAAWKTHAAGPARGAPLVDTWQTRLDEDAAAREPWQKKTWSCPGQAADALQAAAADKRGTADTYVFEVEDAVDNMPKPNELADVVGAHQAPALLRKAAMCNEIAMRLSLESMRMHMAHEGDIDVYTSMPMANEDARRMTFSSFLRRAANGERVYVTGAPIAEHLFKPISEHAYGFAERVLAPMGLNTHVQDIEIFVQAGNTATEKQNVAVTPLHRDQVSSLLLNVFGSKQVRLFSPRMRKHLYPTRDPNDGTWGSERSKLPAPLDDGVMASLFPCYENARSTLVTLHPGDALLIPEGWWHEVTTYGASVAISFRYDDAGAESAHEAARRAGDAQWTCNSHELRRGANAGWDGQRRDEEF